VVRKKGGSSRKFKKVNFIRRRRDHLEGPMTPGGGGGGGGGGVGGNLSKWHFSRVGGM